ncbi:MAG: hypothetical protein EBE86_009520 [Hormoscilla sp. GUM202]|nr:hypothetical protein [Hormoscilla sp. GUM202]
MSRMITALLLALCLSLSLGQGTALAFPAHNFMFVGPVAVIELNVPPAEIVKPGPPPTIRLNDWYYKVFNTKEQAENVEAQWKTVENNGGVPVPKYEVKEVLYQGRNMWGFRSHGVNGTFFQVQKPGKIKPLMDWVKVQTDRKVLERARNIFIYVKGNMGDAQGYVEIKAGLGMNFIDINTPGTSPNAEDVINAINEKLNSLP